MHDDPRRRNERRQFWMIIFFILGFSALIALTSIWMSVYPGVTAWPGLAGIVVLVVVIFAIGRRWKSSRRKGGNGQE